MKTEHKAATATALFLIVLGAGSILFGPVREPPRAATPAAVARALIVPIASVAFDDLTDSWGAPRKGGRRHQGVDIMADAGTPVCAAADGTIAKLFKSKRGGITVYQFDETGRLVLYYAHLKGYEADLKEGQRVAQGQVIGYVGATGNATRPHLHFEVARAAAARQWWRGHAVNPYMALKVGRVELPKTAAVAGR